MNSINEIAGWIDAFVREWACHGQTPTLRQCMVVGSEHAGMSVLDGAGIEHRAGSPCCEQAFLAALADMVASGCIEPTFAGEQQAALTLWAAGDPLDPRTRGDVIDIPLRARERAGPPEDTRTSAQRAGDHLLGLLKSEGRVCYSRFYDGSDEAARRLREVCGCTSDVVSAELLMDLAAGQQEEQGVIRLVTLHDRLADGENDYAIELTDEGRALLASGRQVRFRNVVR